LPRWACRWAVWPQTQIPWVDCQTRARSGSGPEAIGNRFR
jgi:hypothetical protein